LGEPEREDLSLYSIAVDVSDTYRDHGKVLNSHECCRSNLFEGLLFPTVYEVDRHTFAIACNERHTSLELYVALCILEYCTSNA
jgi:hypothetical protein